MIKFMHVTEEFMYRSWFRVNRVTRQAMYCTHNVTLRCFNTTQHNNCCSGKAKSNKYYECVSAFFHLVCAVYTILQSVICLAGWLAVPYFSTLSLEQKEVTEHKMCVMIFSTTFSEIFFILWKFSEMLSWMYTRPHVQYPLFLSYFNKTWIFLTDFQKILQYQISWKFVSWQPSCSMWMERGTDRMKLMLPFCNFVKAPKYYLISLHYICSIHTAASLWATVYHYS
jgi:hypothetical protein